jgi:beta-mannosidase
VPGNVELDLVRAGLEQDPFLADHVLDFEKYEYSNWLFERRFTADIASKAAGTASFRRDQHFANIYLNGKLILEPPTC